MYAYIHIAACLCVLGVIPTDYQSKNRVSTPPIPDGPFGTVMGVCVCALDASICITNGQYSYSLS